MERKVLDVIDVGADLAPYGFSAIYSGVGTGKNTFIEGLLTEDGTFKGGLSSCHRVLLVTSRKAKVEETFKRHGNGIKNFTNQIYDKEDIAYSWEIEEHGKSVVCTNAHFANRLKHVRMDDPNYYFWEQFDYIIFDEFHSIVMDATFTENCHLIKFFLDFFYERYVKDKNAEEIKKHILLMSGTPEPAEGIVKQYNTNVIDYRKILPYKKPKKYFIITKTKVFGNISVSILHNRTNIYFMSYLNSVEKIIDDLNKKGIDTSDCVAIYISDNDKMKEIQQNYPEIFKNSEIVRTCLSEGNPLPNNIKLLLTNNACKEGINILSKVENIFVESHLLIDIIQMCGRVRDVDKVESVYLVKDANQFYAPKDRYIKEREYQVEYAKKEANRFLLKLANEVGYYDLLHCAYDFPEIEEFIKYIENNTKRIRYNPFTEKFDENICFDIAMQYISENLEKYTKNLEEYKFTKKFLDDDYKDHFDGASINNSLIFDKEKMVYDYFRNKWGIDNLEGYKFKSEDKERIHNELQMCSKACGISKTYEGAGTLLRAFGFRIVYDDDHKTKTSKFKIVKNKK